MIRYNQKEEINRIQKERGRKMKMYLVTMWIDLIGEEEEVVVGVYSSIEKAEKAIEEAPYEAYYKEIELDQTLRR